jgi:hypothetical protein
MVTGGSTVLKENKTILPADCSCEDAHDTGVVRLTKERNTPNEHSWDQWTLGAEGNRRELEEQ